MITALPLLTPETVTSELSDAYVAYAYSYPHKSAYGPIDPPVPLAPLWRDEPSTALLLYWHIPFCEMRCGFCNLFARAGGSEALLDAYMDALERQARVLADAATYRRRVVRMAVGGGTPTFLPVAYLERLFDLAEKYFHASPLDIPTSVETSPKTATAAHLACLRRHGVERVSIGVQSFLDRDNHAIGRPQSVNEVRAALERLRAFPVLNIDLIYGQPTQTVDSWLTSVRAALSYRPDELYLYPLYLRPGTGIARKGSLERAPAALSRQFYREARDLLLGEGYEQISMRFFRARHTGCSEGPVYCCQTDGMAGLGCGARSYTARLHYSSRFAVEPVAVQSLIEEWVGETEEELGRATWGYRLTDDDRRRRHVIQSLLNSSGLSEGGYRAIFDGNATDHFPQLAWLGEHSLADLDDGVWRLTAEGLELSDVIGPALYAPAVLSRLLEFART